jgi:ferredoxin-like protein FixX
MTNVTFRNILIVDTAKYTAKYVQFQKGLNVITSSENHVGKSSLAKSLYYTLGAEIDYDPHWDKNNKLYCLNFSVDDKSYKIVRQKKNFLLFKDELLVAECSSVTKELTPKLNEVFDFSIHLPDRNQKSVLAPPVFTYLPYYIDQDSGWGTEPYESFANLDQFKKTDRIKSLYYHLGVYNKHSVETMASIEHNKSEIERLQESINRSEITLEQIIPEVQELIPANDVEELEKMLLPSKQKIEKIISELIKVRERIQKLQSNLLQHRNHLKTVAAHDKNETIDSKQIVNICPNCGYEYDTEFSARVRKIYNVENEDYLVQQIRYIITSLETTIADEEKRYIELMGQLKTAESILSKANDQYDTYVKYRGLMSTITRMHQTIGESKARQDEYVKENKNKSKELKDLPNKKEVDEKYIEDTRSNIISLGAWDNDYNGKIGLLKPLKGQGTLSSKIILAQYIALFSTMESAGVSRIRFPFVVDSPRTKEPSVNSSVEILNMISEISSLPQIILVTMDYSTFNLEQKHKAHLIELTEQRKLLNAVDYQEHKIEIKGYLDLIANIENEK